MRDCTFYLCRMAGKKFCHSTKTSGHPAKIISDSDLLLPVYEVQGKEIFSFCLSVHGGEGVLLTGPWYPGPGPFLGGDLSLWSKVSSIGGAWGTPLAAGEDPSTVLPPRSHPGPGQGTPPTWLQPYPHTPDPRQDILSLPQPARLL